MKKLFGLILSLVMVLSMSTIAFAGGTEEIINGGASTIELGKIYKLLNNGTENPDETFNFTITNHDVSDSYYTDEENIPSFDPASYTISFEKGKANLLESTVNGVTFRGYKNTTAIPLPTYDKVGIYTYKIEETAGNTAGVDYDASLLYLTVTVTQGDNGLVRTTALHYGTKDGEKTDTFKNTYKAGNLVISKNVTGNMGQRERYFEVKVTLKAPEKKTVKSEITISGGSNTANPTNVIFDSAENKKEIILLVKHNDSITLSNIPYGVTYEVNEVDYTTDGYTTSYAYDDTYSYTAEEGTIATGQGTTNLSDTAKETVTVTNNKGMEVDTGIFVDNLPYIVILGVVVAGMGAFFIKKRTANNN